MSPGQKRREIDLTWVSLVGLTLAMFLLDRDPQLRPWLVGVLFGIAVLKSILIGAIFMGLLRASRPALVLIALSFLSLGGALTALLT